MIDSRAAAAGWPAEQVVSAAQQGDPRAITALVSGSHAHVRRFARTLCSTPEDAEDAAQEALIVLYRRIGTLRASAALGSWMFQIVRNECVRRARIALRTSISARAVESSAEDAVLVRLEIERIVESISELPFEQRAVLVLRDVQGLSGAATAQALGLSRAAMKSRLHRARATLRSQLSTPNGTTDEGDVGMRDDGRSTLASTSVARHLTRGAIGFGLIGCALGLAPSTGPVALLMVLPGMIALRGCPTCWIAGLIETISAGRLQRTCGDAGCTLRTATAITPERATADGSHLSIFDGDPQLLCEPWSKLHELQRVDDRAAQTEHGPCEPEIRAAQIDARQLGLGEVGFEEAAVGEDRGVDASPLEICSREHAILE
jgi:RNA polymerase sigma factor (sigma-70 family)